MAYTTINKSTDYFNTKLYTGNGSVRTETGVGFQPDWVWIKDRTGTNAHTLTDAVRGANYQVYTNLTNAQTNASGYLTAFASDGFTLGTDGAVNTNSSNYVAWNWKAGTTGSGSTTGTGTAKAYSYSVDTTAGFSIVTYKGNGSAGQQIPHHLGAVPHFILLKPLDRVDNWRVYHHKLDYSSPANYQLKINNTAGRADGSDVWNNTIPTSTYFTLGSNAGVVANDEDFIAYCFTEKTGYSKFGSYTGNANASGPFINTGFKPAWVMFKGNNTSNWQLWDNKRDTFNPVEKALHPDINNTASTDQDIDFLSNGFKIRGSVAHINGSGVSFYYMAFAEAPLVGTNNIPNNAR